LIWRSILRSQRGMSLLLFAGVLSFALQSCGYRLRSFGEPGGLPIQSLAIPLMTTRASTLGFEGDLTRIVREEFISRSAVPLVSKEEATAVLIGHIYEIKTEPLSYRLDQTVVQGQITTFEATSARRIRIKMEARLVERDTGRVIWREGAMEEKSTFQVGTDPLMNRYHQRKALEDMADRLAKRLYMKTLERF